MLKISDALIMIEDDASHSAQLSDHSVSQPSTEMEKLKLWLLSVSVSNSRKKKLKLCLRRGSVQNSGTTKG